MFWRKNKSKQVEDTPKKKKSIWRMTSEELKEEITENIVERDSRTLGKAIKTEIPVNVIPQLNLTAKETKLAMKRLEELSKQELNDAESLQAENDRLAHEYGAIRTFLYTALDNELEVGQKLLIAVDCKFEAHLPPILKELSFSYNIEEYKRNPDVIKIDSSIPLRYAFSHK